MNVRVGLVKIDEVTFNIKLNYTQSQDLLRDF